MMAVVAKVNVRVSRLRVTVVSLIACMQYQPPPAVMPINLLGS